MSRHEELGDGLNAGRVAQDAAHNYYSWKLLSEKLDAQGVAPDVKKRVLGSRSEKEALELHILTVIQGDEYGESSANYSQLVDLTGTRDKISMAKFLAEKVYEREATKMILNRFAPAPSGAAGTDPVTGLGLTGFQALINRPRDAANAIFESNLGESLISKALKRGFATGGGSASSGST